LLTPRAALAIIAALVCGLIVAFTVHRGSRTIARIAVGAQAFAILAGWFGAQAPALVPGHFTLTNAASGDATIVAFLIACGAGAVFLIPSLVLLFAVFKGPVPSDRNAR
jgi:cytochrome d ubiquinol oxidase subunit II